jgi:hypothetical protein
VSVPENAPRIVAVVTPDLQPRLRSILAGCDIRFVRMGSDLVRALDEARCDMMIVEVHFDHSAAVAALMCVRARQDTFPVVCMRAVRPAESAGAVLDVLRVALGALIARQLIDLAEHRDDEASNARVRAMLEPFMRRAAARAA